MQVFRVLCVCSYVTCATSHTTRTCVHLYALVCCRQPPTTHAYSYIYLRRACNRRTVPTGWLWWRRLLESCSPARNEFSARLRATLLHTDTHSPILPLHTQNKHMHHTQATTTAQAVDLLVQTSLSARAKHNTKPAAHGPILCCICCSCSVYVLVRMHFCESRMPPCAERCEEDSVHVSM